MPFRLAVMGLGVAVAAALCAGPVQAQSDPIGEFYKGRQMRIVIGSSAGAGFDQMGRLIARHLPKHLSGGPQIIASNMPGAGSQRAVQSLSAEPKDGTYMVLFNPGQIMFALLNPAEVKGFKFTDLAYVGSATADVRVCWAWHTTGVKTLQDLLKKDRFATGHTGSGAATYIDAAVVKNVFGAKLNQIVGYPGATEQRIAVERGELDGDCGTIESVPEHWQREGKANIFIRISRASDEQTKNVPWIGDLGTPEQKRQIEFLLFYHDLFRPFIVHKEVPAPRLQALRDAFWKTVNDKDFREEAKKFGREIVTPLRGEDVQKIVEDIYKTPDDFVKKSADLIK